MATSGFRRVPVHAQLVLCGRVRSYRSDPVKDATLPAASSPAAQLPALCQPSSASRAPGTLCTCCLCAASAQPPCSHSPPFHTLQPPPSHRPLQIENPVSVLPLHSFCAGLKTAALNMVKHQHQVRTHARALPAHPVMCTALACTSSCAHGVFAWHGCACTTRIVPGRMCHTICRPLPSCSPCLRPVPPPPTVLPGARRPGGRPG